MSGATTDARGRTVRLVDSRRSVGHAGLPPLPPRHCPRRRTQGEGSLWGPSFSASASCSRTASAQPKPVSIWLAFVFAAVGAKLVGVYARFWMVDSLYSGAGDSTVYDRYGRVFAESFRSFDFAVDPERPIPGTGFLRVLTGVVYAIFGSDRFTGFLIFGMLSLIGCWFFYRAFSTAMPNADHKRYAILIFFWPTVVFWPAAIGKEAWMILSLGLASWGAAKRVPAPSQRLPTARSRCAWRCNASAPYRHRPS